MNRALEIPACDMRDRVGEVDGYGSRLCGDVGPVSVFTEDLQPRDRLPEKESHSTEICMAGSLSESAGFVLFGCSLMVDHVPEVIFGTLLVGVLLDKVLFIWELENNSKKSEKRKNDIGV